MDQPVVAAEEHPTADAPEGTPAAARSPRRRVIAAAVLGAIIAAFALLNFDTVKVHWLVTTGHTPLIVVIVLAFALGIGVDRLLILRGKRKRLQGAK